METNRKRTVNRRIAERHMLMHFLFMCDISTDHEQTCPITTDYLTEDP